MPPERRHIEVICKVIVVPSMSAIAPGVCIYHLLIGFLKNDAPEGNQTKLSVPYKNDSPSTTLDK
jgi:uncharacterized membrane protein YjjB (DUF3815 family)